jgi:hypothetical protein
LNHTRMSRFSQKWANQVAVWSNDADVWSESAGLGKATLRLAGKRR